MDRMVKAISGVSGWLIVLLVAFIQPGIAFSNYDVATCEGCSESIRAHTAIVATDYNGGRAYVVDRISGDIYPYQVLVLDEPGLYEITVATIPGWPEEIDTIQSALDALDILTSLTSVDSGDLSMPPGSQTPISGFDIPANPTAQALLRDAVSSHLSGQLGPGLLSGGVQILTSIFLDDFMPAVTVTFPDGTSYEMIHTHTTIDAITGEITVHFEIVENSGRDADGLLIPESVDDIHPGFSRQTGNEESWGGLLTRIGFTQGPGIIWEHPGDCLACTWEETPSGGTLTCSVC